ncbi:MAG: ABC transporter ATP-binding protein [Methanobrevibacter sp.]|uniref:ABC transporter ATP-binding protein n=1 Tax=Methanobrevibacter millerae TaxID=230361 RepID=A0A8T3VD08_9EURY|nr:ABC transporter ATP-binding protein [Methanobrevibacter millerae]MBE6504176.1 ABC transporter ATP-binding protein [Methanobrevibacter millerae]MBQ6345434.1 ABC transporter ATP-binding protein [Methanobrevibacter sp.]MBR0372179.1 ABC transporter ATP-binding protein [Methanobrevibacter sp.]
MELIRLTNVLKQYDDGAVTALNNINLSIEKGSFVSIIGPSGSGKSTLLNMLGALDSPDSGQVIINGIDLARQKDLSDFRRHEIGFIFQLHNLLPNLNVQENVEIPLMDAKMPEKDKHRRALLFIEAVGLLDKRKQKPNKLSGGERQRVAIARALVNFPSIILADEPTGALDTKNGQKVLDVLRFVHESIDATLIIVTHDIDVARLADRTIEIRDGQVINDYYNR